MDFPQDPVERFDFGATTAVRGALDPGYVVHAMAAVSVADDAESVGRAHPQERGRSAEGSTGEGGEEPHSVAFIDSTRHGTGKKRVALDDGVADEAQFTLKPRSPWVGKEGMLTYPGRETCKDNRPALKE